MVTLKRTKAIAVIASAIFLARLEGVAETADTTKSKVDYSVGVDLYSRYLWRGMQIGNLPAFQPTMKLVYKDLTIGYWGSYQGGPAPESDLYLTYNLPKGFSLTVTDYFISPSESMYGNYFQYKSGDLTTCHAVEGSVGYTGPEKFPLAVLIGYYFLATNGTTAIPAANGAITEKSSIYAEVDYTFKNLTLIVGSGNKMYSTYMKTDGTFTDGSFAVVNVGAKITKSVVITDKFSLPITGQLMLNPVSKHLYYAVGFSF